MGPKLSLFVVPGSQPPPLGPLREVMIMLLLRRCFVAAHGGSEAKNPKDLEAVELEDVKPQLVLQASWSSNAVLGSSWVGGFGLEGDRPINGEKL